MSAPQNASTFTFNFQNNSNTNSAVQPNQPIKTEDTNKTPIKTKCEHTPSKEMKFDETCEQEQNDELKKVMDELRLKTPLSEAKNFGEYLLARPVTAAEKWDMYSCSCWTVCMLLACSAVPVLQYNEKVCGGMLALSGLCALGAIFSTVVSASCDGWQEHKLKKRAMEKIWRDHGTNTRG